MIHLHADHLTAPVLKDWLEAHHPSGTYALRPNPYADRSGADPVIVAALIAGGAGLLAALIQLMGTMYTEHKKDQRAAADKQETEDLKVLVRLQQQQIAGLISKVGVAAARQSTETEAHEDVFDHLVLDPALAATVTDPANPYHSFFTEMPAEQVTAISLITDD